MLRTHYQCHFDLAISFHGHCDNVENASNFCGTTDVFRLFRPKPYSGRSANFVLKKG